MTSVGGDGRLRPVTDLDEPAAGAYLPTTDEIVVATSAGGGEHTQLYLVRDDGRELRPLLVDPDHIHRLGGATRDGRLLAVATNARTGADFDVVVVAVDDPSNRRVVFDRGGWVQPRGFSPDGRWLAVSRMTARSGDDELFLVDVAGGDIVEVAPHDQPVRLGAPAWRADGSSFFFSTDCDRDFRAIALFDLATRSWRYVLERDGDTDCALDWSGRQLLVETEREGCTVAELVDPDSLATLRTVPLPGPGSAGLGFSRDGGLLAYSFTSAREPGDVWVYRCRDGTTTRLTTMPRGVDADHLVEPTVHRIASFDGEMISLFVYHPAPGGPGGPAPVVVSLHGGPESQHRPAFDPLVQYLV
ncbi:MAG: hypothetical protein M3N98_09355, partial [Actinomycetota bacterium]|nr:hypothetical protein [Actinomycetota bacterium]